MGRMLIDSLYRKNPEIWNNAGEAEEKRLLETKSNSVANSIEVTNISEDQTSGHKTIKLDVVLFLFICLFIGQLMKQFNGITGIPYTSLVTIVGLIFGATYDKLGRLGEAIAVYSEIDAHLLLLLFLPALIFESAFNSDWHIFKIEFNQILIMAGPMLVVCTFMSAAMMRFILGYQGEFTWDHAMIYGSIISATDPVAVVALLKELGASKRLSTLIEGESLLNDGTAMVVFSVLMEIAKGKEMGAGEIIGMFCRLSLGGPILGIIAGIILSLLLSRIHNNGVLEVNATIFVSYFAFYVAENTILHVSGILAIMSLGLYMTNTGKTSISTESEHSVHHVWGFIGFMAETVIFILTGIIMGQRASNDSMITGVDYALVLATYALLHFIRFFCILLFWPVLRVIGYGLTFKQLLLCSYAGLRGAVGMSLALIVAVDESLPKYSRDVILLHVLGVALLTLLINATTTGWVVKKLGLSRQSDIKQNILVSISYQLDHNLD